MSDQPVTPAFEAAERIDSGEWDANLAELLLVVTRRIRLTTKAKRPRDPLPKGQTWVWVSEPETPRGGQWETRSGIDRTTEGERP